MAVMGLPRPAGLANRPGTVGREIHPPGQAQGVKETVWVPNRFCA